MTKLLIYSSLQDVNKELEFKAEEEEKDMHMLKTDMEIVKMNQSLTQR